MGNGHTRVQDSKEHRTERGLHHAVDTEHTGVRREFQEERHWPRMLPSGEGPFSQHSEVWRNDGISLGLYRRIPQVHIYYLLRARSCVEFDGDLRIHIAEFLSSRSFRSSRGKPGTKALGCPYRGPVPSSLWVRFFLGKS